MSWLLLCCAVTEVCCRCRMARWRSESQALKALTTPSLHYWCTRDSNKCGECSSCRSFGTSRATAHRTTGPERVHYCMCAAAPLNEPSCCPEVVDRLRQAYSARQADVLLLARARCIGGRGGFDGGQRRSINVHARQDEHQPHERQKQMRTPMLF